VTGDKVPQWLAARHQLWIGVRGGVENVHTWFEPRLTPHRTGRTCKETHPTRSRSSCGVRCLRNCLQIPRFDRCSASLLCCMAVHLPHTFTTHQMLMAQLCASRVPVESIKVAFPGPYSSQYLPPGYASRWLRLPRTSLLSAIIMTMVTS
jgi:hypothetical protein